MLSLTQLESEGFGHEKLNESLPLSSPNGRARNSVRSWLFGVSKMLQGDSVSEGSYRGIVGVEMNTRMVWTILSWKRNQGSRRSRAPSSYLNLTTGHEELGTTVICGIMHANMLDTNQVLAAWNCSRDTEFVTSQPYST